MRTFLTGMLTFGACNAARWYLDREDRKDQAIAGGNFSKVVSKAPFMSTQSVRKLAKACMAAGDLDTLKKIAIFM